jgi:hypothetical protein
MVTSRSVPQQTEQIVSALAGQNRFALRFWQIGQVNLDTPSSRSCMITLLQRITHNRAESPGLLDALDASMDSRLTAPGRLAYDFDSPSRQIGNH